jgi:hypothetical protein
MKNIQPTYVSFEQAKALDKKGYINGSKLSYDHLGNLIAPYYGNTYTNGKENGDSCFESPEQWQVVEWLRVNHSIWVEVLTEKSLFIFQIKKIGKEGFIAGKFENTPQEAYSAAFDYVLNNNLI